MISDYAGTRSVTGDSQALQPKKAAVRWFEPGEADANNTEILFYSFVLVAANVRDVTSLEKWADAVRAQRERAEQQRAAWKPLEHGEHGFGLKNSISPTRRPPHHLSFLRRADPHTPFQQ